MKKLAVVRCYVRCTYVQISTSTFYRLPPHYSKNYYGFLKRSVNSNSETTQKNNKILTLCFLPF